MNSASKHARLSPYIRTLAFALACSVGLYALIAGCGGNNSSPCVPPPTLCPAATCSALESPKDTRVVVLANTDAEADELMAVLNSRDVRPPTLGAPQPSTSPRGLRGFYKANGVRVEFWCVWELADGDNTREKVRQLPNVIQPRDKVAPAMVIAFGTAAGHWDKSHNGSVVVGSAVLLHSLPSLENKEVTETLARQGIALDTIIESEKGWKFLCDSNLTDFIKERRAEIKAKFLKPPLNPAADPDLLLSADRLGLASINVINGNDYARADAETLSVAVEAMSKSTKTFEVGGVETTHGIIRAFTPKTAPFIYVTGITNRLGHFPDELMPRRAAQHVAVVNNAGVVAAYLIDFILRNPNLLTRSL